MSMPADGFGSSPDAPLALHLLLVELDDLKLVRSAGRNGSIPERLFVQGWSALSAGGAPADVMLQVTASALAATRLCDLDSAFLKAAGLRKPETAQVLLEVFDAVTEAVEAELRAPAQPAFHADSAARWFLTRLRCRVRAPAAIRCDLTCARRRSCWSRLRTMPSIA